MEQNKTTAAVVWLRRKHQHRLLATPRSKVNSEASDWLMLTQYWLLIGPSQVQTGVSALFMNKECKVCSKYIILHPSYHDLVLSHYQSVLGNILIQDSCVDMFGQMTIHLSEI